MDSRLCIYKTQLCSDSGIRFGIWIMLRFTITWVAAKQCSALVWHTRGRVFEPRLLQQVLRFVGRVYTVQYVELREYYPWVWWSNQSIRTTVSDAIIRSWLLSTTTRSSSLGYFSRLLQVVDNWAHILW